jgi:hypothetical protein
MKRRLSAQTSVYSAEATAIFDAGKEKQMDWEKHLILTDSLSTILAIQNNNKSPLIQKFVKQLHDGGGDLRNGSWDTQASKETKKLTRKPKPQPHSLTAVGS